MYLTIFQSIEKCHLLHFYYDGYFRVVEPHAYGIDRRGRNVLYGFQIAGTDLFGRHRGWKCYVVDRIECLHALDAHFLGPHVGYKGSAVTHNWQRLYAEIKGCHPAPPLDRPLEA